MNRRLVIIVLIVLAVVVNWLYDGKIAEFIGNTLHTWQTGETPEDRLAREAYRERIEKQVAGVDACPALRDFAQDVAREPADRRGVWAEVLVANVRGNPDRELVSEYLAAFENLAFKESREFDEELQRIVHQYCDSMQRRSDSL